MQNADWLTNLKLRISYGIQGNVDKNTSPLVVGEWGNTSVLPGGSEPNIGVTNPPNPYLRWEKTTNWNVGLDMGVLNNRITFSIDAYHRVSSDLIGTRALPGENGFDYAPMNWAKVTNKGVEFSLSTVNVKTKDFRWVMDFNIAHNKSKINSIETPDNSYLPSGEGYSIGALFALKTAGLDENGIPMFWKDGQKVSFSDFYGLEVNHDLFGDATLSSKLSNQEYRDLFTYVGTSEPKFTGGLINRFYYKNFDLTISGSFIIDQTVQETPFYDPSQTSPGQNYSKRMFDVWSSSNPNGKYPALLGKTMEDGSLNMAQQWISLKDPGNSFRNYDIWFKQMSYFRVNSIRLGYTLPSDIAKKLRLASMRVSLETRNPFVIGTSYKGYFDPETYGSIYAQPLAKTFSCGLDLTF